MPISSFEDRDRSTSQLRHEEVGLCARAQLPLKVVSPRWKHWRQCEFVDSERYESFTEAWKDSRRYEELRKVCVDTGEQGLRGMGDPRGRYEDQRHARAAVREHNRAVDAVQDALEVLLKYREMFGDDAPELMRDAADKALKDIA